MKTQEFKVKPNLAVGLTLIMLAVISVVYISNYFVAKTMTTAQFIVYLIFVGCMYFYFLGCRPTAYVVGNKTIVMKKRLIPDKEIDLMHAEVICDPVSRLADLVTRPHAIEIYMDTKKRWCFFPKDPVGFTGAVVNENKRIHCTVQKYTDLHRSIVKRERKSRRRNERRARRDQGED